MIMVRVNTQMHTHTYTQLKNGAESINQIKMPH